MHAIALALAVSMVGQPPGPAVGTGDFTALVAFAALDVNQDRALNANEWRTSPSGPQPPPFGEVDADHDGLIVVGEFLQSVRPASSEPRVSRGDRRVLATSLVFVADDFVVDLYHNGVKLPDERRTMLDEVFGAMVERVDVEVREGDWLVFNVVNNRLRWGGVQYFGVAGLNAGGEPRVGFVSRADGRWSACDDPMLVPRFIADRDYLATRSVRVIERRWDQGDSRMNSLADGWNGQPVWGESRNTWIKFRAEAARSDPAIEKE